jgi:exopolysaccharide biosynthesis predicted pyruvyltransferase EpsI
MVIKNNHNGKWIFFGYPLLVANVGDQFFWVAREWF